MLESGIERKFATKCKQWGVLTLKFSPMGHRGYPDRVVLLRGGRPTFIEFKRPGEHPSKLQLERIRELRLLGYDVHVFHSATKALAYVWGKK